jgi:hypothetical protein
MHHTSDDSLGRRRFQILKEQAIESAIEKIRHAPAAEWQSFSHTDYTRLREILGDLWVHLEREKWSRYSFSMLTRQDIRDLLDLGGCAPGRIFSSETLIGMDAILSHSRSPIEP